MADRPISPHLTDGMRLHWKWGAHMLVSILHRVSGDGMALIGLPVLLWWLGALASGEAAYTEFQGYMMSPIGVVVLIGLSWAFFNHMCSGLRHFVLDMGAGFELDTNRRWSIGSMLGAVALTVAFWVAVWTL